MRTLMPSCDTNFVCAFGSPLLGTYMIAVALIVHKNKDINKTGLYFPNLSAMNPAIGVPMSCVTGRSV